MRDYGKCCFCFQGLANSVGYCGKCYRERRIVSNQCSIAQKKGLEGSLSLLEWIRTLDYFQWKCAYCKKEEYQVLEHYVPINCGGGTTYRNCVPACRSCNGRKGEFHPSDVKNMSLSCLEEVGNFLNSHNQTIKHL